MLDCNVVFDLQEKPGSREGWRGQECPWGQADSGVSCYKKQKRAPDTPSGSSLPPQQELSFQLIPGGRCSLSHLGSIQSFSALARGWSAGGRLLQLASVGLSAS